jgi:hypothetical protein
MKSLNIELARANYTVTTGGKITLRELAQLAFPRVKRATAVNYLSRWQKGELMHLATPERVAAICKVCGCDAEQIVIN